MARKVILKENGLNGSGTAPSGYKYFGDSGGDISQKIGATVSGICGSPLTPTTLVVDIAAADLIGAGGYFIKELLPDIAPNYYVGELTLEFTPGVTPFVVTGGSMVYAKLGNAPVVGYIDAAFLTSANKSYITVPFTSSYITTVLDPPTVDSNLYYPDTNAYTALNLYAYQAGISAGDGTMKVIITYTERTFGV